MANSTHKHTIITIVIKDTIKTHAAGIAHTTKRNLSKAINSLIKKSFIRIYNSKIVYLID